MSHRVAAAQRVFDTYNTEYGRINGDEGYANKLLAELTLLVRGIPDAIAAIQAAEQGRGPSAMPLSLPAIAAAALYRWAESVLSEPPAGLGNFPRWAQHIGGILPSRRRELLGIYGIPDAADQPKTKYTELAEQIIDVAAKLGIVGVVERPTAAITHGALWNIIDRLCDHATDRPPYLGPLVREIKSLLEAARISPPAIAHADAAEAFDGPVERLLPRRLRIKHARLNGKIQRYHNDPSKSPPDRNVRLVRGVHLIQQQWGDAFPTPPDTLRKLLYEVKGRIVWMSVGKDSGNDLAVVVEHMREFHRRARYLGVASLPPLPMAERMRLAEAEAFLLGLQEVLERHRDATGPSEPGASGSGSVKPEPGAADVRDTANHNTDFTMVNWYGEEYRFALGVQSSAVKVLWEEWSKTRLGLHQDTIRNGIDAERDSFRMDTAFRHNRAFGAMIQRCGDGVYKLAKPEAQGEESGPKAQRPARITAKSRRKRG